MAYQAVALFSGGLDSILAARLIMEQGITVRCLHFTSPFFGKPEQIEHWQNIYGVEIEPLDIGEEYIHLLTEQPKHGFGKIMNPCVDCKILMMRQAKIRMQELGATFMISGEVLGQRPMSQRKDSLHVIQRDGDVKNLLLRPLCAQHLDPTAAELSGVVDRSRLLSIFGRGRKEQLALAKSMGLTEIPSPAGGCRLAEKENARRYWPILSLLDKPTAADFYLANVGRQFWAGTHWLSIGRNAADNDALAPYITPEDLLIKVPDMPGPLAVARRGSTWDNPTLREAAAFVASFSPRALNLHSEVDVRLWQEGNAEAGQTLRVLPNRHCALTFNEPSFEEVKNALRERARAVDANNASWPLG